MAFDKRCVIVSKTYGKFVGLNALEVENDKFEGLV